MEHGAVGDRTPQTLPFDARLAINVNAAATDVRTSVHPTSRNRVGAGGRTASHDPAASPGAAASSVVHGSSVRAAVAARAAVPAPVSMSTVIRVERAARGSPPPRAPRTITRAASVPTTKTRPKAIPTARAVLSEAVAARQMGTASSENADATATSATALFSRAATIATATKLAGSNGSVSDHRVSGDSDQKPRNPAPAAIAPVIASHAARR